MTQPNTTPLSPVDYLLIGHITADLTPNGRTLGGTVSYAAPTVQAFGLRVGILTSAAHDEPLLQTLYPIAQVVNIAGAHTSTFENIYTPDGRIQYIRAVADQLTPEMLPEAWRSAALVHLAPLTDEVSTGFLDLFPNAKKMATLQGWLRVWGDDGRVHFKRWHDRAALKKLDLVVFSEEDILEAPDMEQALVADGNHVIVTQAERGGIHYEYGQPRRYDTPQVEVVHPTGAGDVFASSLLAAWHVLGDLTKAMPIAAALGAQCVTRFGLSGAPTPQEVQRLLAAVD